MWEERNDFGFLKIFVEKEDSDSECHDNELNEDRSSIHNSNPMHDSEIEVATNYEASLNDSSEDEEFVPCSMTEQISMMKV